MTQSHSPDTQDLFPSPPQEDMIGPLSNSFIGVTVGGETKTIRYDEFVKLLFKVDTFKQMVNHAALGVCGEAGELADCLKKHVHYGKKIDFQNLVEELGDLRFYIQSIQNIFNIPERAILQYNANKLSKRYAELAYSDEAAIARADKKED